MAIDSSTRAEFRALVEATRKGRGQVADLIKAGQWLHAEPDEARGEDYALKMRRAGAEALRGETIDFLPTPFLEQGAHVARAVGKVVVSFGGATEEGSGVLVAPGVLLTNQHVLRDADAAASATVAFDFEDDRRPNRRVATTFALDPTRGFVASPEVGGLDYAIVALGHRISGPALPDELPTCPLMDSPNRHRLGMPVNIIQHPGGRQRVVALRENRLLERTPRVLLYETDTEQGSSGAPVFNDLWELVALHHYGEPFVALDEGVTLSNPALNEGIRISAIVADLRQRLEQARRQAGDAAAVELMARVLEHGAQAKALAPGKLLQAGPADAGGEAARPLTSSSSSKERPMRDVTLVLPEGVAEATLTVRFAEPGSARPADGAANRKPAALVRRAALDDGSERRRIDRDYANRDGFDGRFLKGMPIDLKAILAPQKKNLAPLLEGDDGLLHYQHFSLAMHRRRRLAILTATNIEGPSYLSIDRKTGAITPLGAEGETWYTDPRIANEYLVTQDWYSEWSHLFDRGHLTRRNDPTWGDEESARRAEMDTFHFSNCTPQHWQFNQSATHWQGIERYVLESGVHETRSRLSVLQGPVFGSGDLYGDDLAIPGRFWKLVAWLGKDRVKRAVAFVASQQELFNEERGGRLPDPDEVPPIGEYQVPVSELRQLTQLDLSAFEPWDTFGELPTAGEARRMVRKWADLRIT